MINEMLQLGRYFVAWIKENWPIIAIGFAMVFGVPAILMTIDEACSPVSNAFCRQWLDFQWESIVAGALGLAGGLFVIASTREHIQAAREDAAAEHLQDVDAILRMSQEIDASIHDYLDTYSHLTDDNDFTIWRPAINAWDRIRTNHPSARIQTKIRENEYISSHIKDECGKIEELTGKHAQTVFTAPSYVQILQSIQALHHEWTTCTKKLKEERTKQATTLMRR